MKKLFALALVVMVISTVSVFDTAARAATIEKTFPLKMEGKLVLDLETGGELEITGWAKEEVAVTAEITGKQAEDVRIDFDPGARTLKIHSRCEGRHNCKARVRLVIKVPERADISIDSRGGEVHVEGVAGDISGSTLGGDIDLARIKGHIDLETMGGSVTARECEADGKVSTMGGSILIEDVKGNLEGSTMGGKVVYRNVTGRPDQCADENVNLHTMGGDIVIEKVAKSVKAKTYGGDIDVASGEAVDVSTMGGDVNVAEAPAGAKISTMGGDIEVVSAGKYVKASTMGGDIEVAAIDGWVDVSTMGGDVDVKMTGDPKQGKRDVDISSMGGNITLVVPDGLSMEFDIDLQYTKGKEGRYRIESDFPMDRKETTDWEGHWGNKHKHFYGTGKVAGGEHLIHIKTVNGNITIKRG